MDIVVQRKSEVESFYYRAIELIEDIHNHYEFNEVHQDIENYLYELKKHVEEYNYSLKKKEIEI